MACIGDCYDLGPPPDSILFLPPPPMPAFMQPAAVSSHFPDFLLNNHSGGSPGGGCGTTSQLCESWGTRGGGGGYGGGRSSGAVGGVEYVEMPRKDVESWAMNGIDDTWLLVLVASSIGVLLLGALLAMFLLKCREMNMFGGADCSSLHHHHHSRHNQRHPLKNTGHHLMSSDASSRDHCSSTPSLNSKLIHHQATSSPATVLYHTNNQQQTTLHSLVGNGVGTGLDGNTARVIASTGGANNGSNSSTTATMDNRMVWAALTPRGTTQHYFSENYPRELQQEYAGRGAPVEVEDHYESIDGLLGGQPGQLGYTTYGSYHHKDYGYEDPNPVIDGYPPHHLNQHHLADLDQISRQQQQHQYATLLGNTDMRCAATLLAGLNNGHNTMTTGGKHNRHNGANTGHQHQMSSASVNLTNGSSSHTNTLNTQYRPRVSEPTRIENPNMPPLNLYPQHNSTSSKGATLKRNNTGTTGGQLGTLPLPLPVGYRNGMGDTLPKYAC